MSIVANQRIYLLLCEVKDMYSLPLKMFNSNSYNNDNYNKYKFVFLSCHVGIL